MLESRDRSQDELFLACSLADLIPDDYILKRVDRVLDLSWLRAEVADLYCNDNGRPGIDPEAAVRLMLAGFFQGIVHDRKLMREAQMHIGIRWFAGYALHEKLPDHSSPTRLRQRWGAERFKRIFDRTVLACVKAGLVSAQTVHIDATLIRADVSWESLAEVHADKVLAENATELPSEGDGEQKKSIKGHPKKRSTTDPDATLTTSSKEFRMSPSFKQHTAVDDLAGVVIDAEVTTGEANEGSQLIDQISRIEARLGVHVECVTADKSYAHGSNFEQLQDRNIEAVIPTARVGRESQVFPQSSFKYDQLHDIVRCPAGQKLRRKREGGSFMAQASDCRSCKLATQCLRAGSKRRQLILPPHHVALLRARRKQLHWDHAARKKYTRHRWLVEGRHGEAKTQHGLSRAIRRGLENVQIQAYMTAAVMNLKRLAAFMTLSIGSKKLIKALVTLTQAIFAVLAPVRAQLVCNRRLMGLTAC